MSDLSAKISYNNKILTYPEWNGYLQTTYSDVVLYDYLTFRAAKTLNTAVDIAYGCEKKYTNSYMIDLTANTSAGLKNSSNDRMKWNVTSGKMYCCAWSDEAIKSTSSCSPKSWNSYSVAYNGTAFAGAIGEIYSMDFWSRPNWNGFRMSNCTLLPQDSRNIHRSSVLSACTGLFSGAKISNSIEKFILSMQQVCPRLVNTSACFKGCTAAPDYQHCLTAYPSWF